MFDFDVVTGTTIEQNALNSKVSKRYRQLQENQAQNPDGRFGSGDPLVLHRVFHAKYLSTALGPLPAGFVTLDASRAWICYWALHGLALLEAPLPGEEGWPCSTVPTSGTDVVAFLASCQSPTGGFGGGPGHLSHLATSYAAVCALVTLGTEEALRVVDRASMADFLRRMAVPQERGGGFTVHNGGEVDVRGCFTALAIAYILQLDVQEIGRMADVAGFVKRCQTYEGGIGGEPGNEAHGGYTFCGVAALALFGRLDVLDLRQLLRWAVMCQGSLEGGFMGRTNKLVDGCYSWWQGGVFPILHGHLDVLLQQLPFRPDQPLPIDDYIEACKSPLKPEPLGYSGTSLEYEPLEPKEHAAAAALALEARAQQQRQEAEALEHQAAQEEAQTGVVMVDVQKAAAEKLRESRLAMEAAERAHQMVEHLKSSAAEIFRGSDGNEAQGPAPLFNSEALQAWILTNCQVAHGGMRDKPDKQPDYYHTCYCLSGLSAAQHCPGAALVGPPSNKLARTDPLINVRSDKLERAREFFAALEPAA